MANVKISDLTIETTPASTDLIEMEVGGVSKSVTIANAVAAGVVVESITNAKLAHIATSIIKGRVAAGTGDVEDLSAANVRTIINVADGANVGLTDVVSDTTPQLGGFLDMNKKYISLSTGLSDQEFCGITCEGTGGATAIAFGTLCYLKAADSLWYPAKADVTATSGIVKLGMCVLAGTSAATRMLLYGNIRANSLFPSFSPLSGQVYVSAATAGEVTSTAPTGTTNFVVRSVGRANTADELFFNPSEDYVELA
jgi:hypothetical protein